MFQDSKKPHLQRQLGRRVQDHEHGRIHRSRHARIHFQAAARDVDGAIWGPTHMLDECSKLKHALTHNAQEELEV